MSKKEEIKKAAFELFAFKGYRETSTNDIAKAVGLTKPSLYSHFSSKSELYFEILRDESKFINANIKKVYIELQNEPIEALLRGIFEAIIEVFICKERLLIWKRTFIDFGSGKIEMNRQTDWQFDRKLKNDLYRLLSHYKNLNATEAFLSFYKSYILTIHGYLDWMIIKPHDNSAFQNIWSIYWNGIKHFFND